MSLKSLGKFAALVAVAGLSLTACADASTQQAREQEETCGVIQASGTKANEAIMRAMQQTDGSGERAGNVVESAALDIRNHAFDRSNDQLAPGSDESIKLRTALQVQAASLDEMAATLKDDLNALQSFSPEGIEVDGMTYNDAASVIGAYCGATAQGGM